MKEKEAKKRRMEKERRKKQKEEEQRPKEEEKLKKREGLQKEKASRPTGKQNKGPTTVKSVVCPVCEEWPLLGFASNNGLPKCPKRTLCTFTCTQCESLDSMFNYR